MVEGTQMPTGQNEEIEDHAPADKEDCFLRCIDCRERDCTNNGDYQRSHGEHGAAVHGNVYAGQLGHYPVGQ